MFKLNFLYFVPVATWPVSEHYWEESDSVFFTPSIRYSPIFIRFSWAFSSPEPRSLSLSVWYPQPLINLRGGPSPTCPYLCPTVESKTGYEAPEVSLVLSEGDKNPSVLWQEFS